MNIAEMNQVVKETWYKIDNGNEKVELDIRDIALFLSKQWGVTPDPSGSIKYIQKATFSKKMSINWEDFNALFCKGFFRQAVVACSKRLNTQEN